jgi:hypothetical protein
MPDTPLRLKVAAELAFPQGGMTASGLRREAARGTLVIERIAGKDYTTLQAIEEMRKLCRVQQKARDCGSNQPAATRMETSPSRPYGASETAAASGAQESAMSKLAALRRSPSMPCVSTSIPKRRRARATVTPLKS